jgi:tetratricopeptide (TPR) repeat protein
MAEIRVAGLEDVSASRQRLPAPPATRGPTEDDISALHANLGNARKSMWQGNLDAAQQEVERVLGELSARKRGTEKPEDLQALEGSAESLLGQILVERDGLGARARNALERAIEVLRLVAGAKTASVQAYADYGAALHMLGRRTEAVHALEQAVSLGDTAPLTRRRLASLLLEDGQAQQAKDVLLPVSTAAPGDVELLSLLGRAERDLGQSDAALSHLREAAAAARRAGNLLAALDLYAEASDLAPSDPELHWNHGEVLRRLGRMDDAIGCFDHALAADPDFLQAKIGKADALRVQGGFQAALTLIEEVLSVESGHAYALAIKGDLYRILGNYDQALAALNASLAADATSPWTIGTRGQVFRALNEHVKARDDLRQATAAAPEFAWAWAELAATCYELGDTKPAMAAAKHALKLDRDTPLALAVEARCLRDAGQRTKAIRPLKRLAALKPTPDWVWTDLATALRDAGDAASAQVIVDRAFAEGWAGAELFLVRAELRLAADSEAGKPAIADDLSEYLRSKPADAAGLLRAGRAYRALRDDKHAAEAFGLALTRDDTPEIRFELAAAEFELEHYDRVLDALEALPAPPAQAEDLWRRGVAARMQGDTELANRSFKEALEVQPGYVRALRGLVLLNIERGKLDRAKKYAAIALAEHPRNPEALSIAARVDAILMDYESAFEHLGEALEEDRTNRLALIIYGASLMDTGHFERAVSILERLKDQGEATDTVCQYLGFALENMAVSALPAVQPELNNDIRNLLVRAKKTYEERLEHSNNNFFLRRGRANMIWLLEGSSAARVAYRELVEELEGEHTYNRELIGLLAWCYFRLGRNDEAISAYISTISAETNVSADYLRFDLALATLAAKQTDHVRSEYQLARELCEPISVPRRRGLFKVARNDLVATLIGGGFGDTSIPIQIVADLDQALQDLKPLDKSRPRDPFGNG